ncbi:PQQ-binding-like beta-propeller repeat protein [Thermodesulfobacteriota bacterium]
MKTGRSMFHPLITIPALFCLFFSLIFSGCSQNTATKIDPEVMADEILEKSGVKGGFIVHVNCGDGILTDALKKNDSFLVQGLDSNMDNVTRAREYITSKENYGTVSVDHLTGTRLPYTNNMVNLIVSEGPGDIPMDEVMRVLTPKGVLMTKSGDGWEKTIKPWPAEMDEWNQYLYNAGNNPVSKDTAISPIKHYQWVGSPMWGRHHDTTASLSALVSANGRIFYVIDEGPKESVQLPAENYLYARDAFNGTVLWKKPIPEWQDHMFPMKSGPAYLPRRLVATGERVYVTLGIDAPLSEIDAATGEVLRTFERTDETSEILLSDNTLFLVVGRPEKTDKKYTSTTTYVWDRAQEARTEWAWSKEPARIMSLDMASGKPNWIKDYPIGPLSLSADAKSIYFYNGSSLVRLDRTSGEEKWQSDLIKTRKFDTAYAPRLVVSDGVLVFSVGGQGDFVAGSMMALSAEDGKKLWESPIPFSGHYSPEDIFVIDGAVWTGNIAWGQADGKYEGRDLHTGKLIKEFKCDADIYWFHQRCYPSKATEKYILPSRTGLEFIDLKEEHWDVNHYTRGGCFYGIMPSNGLVYTPPNACGCYLESKLEGFGALGGAFVSEPDLKKEATANRLEKGPAYNEDIIDDSSTGDWPTYRHDKGRSGYTPLSIPSDVESKWKVKLGGKLSSPVAAGNRIYIAQVDAHTVYAINATAGNVLWKYTAGGRVDSPPTIYQGRVLFGSTDGYVYCLNSANGQLIWRFRAAPMDRRMMSYEQLESVWPVHGSVLVENDKIYCVAGRSVFLDGGMRLLQLNPRTGEKLSEKIIDKIDPNTGKDIQFLSVSLDMPVALNDILSSNGKHFYMRSQEFDMDGNRTFIGVRDLKDQTGEGAHVFSPIGFLDDSQFFRSYMMYGKSVKGGWGSWEMMGKLTPSGRVIAVDDNTVYGFSRKPEFYSESVVIDFQLYASEIAGEKQAVEKITALPKTMDAFDKGLFNYAGDWKLRQGIPRDEQTAVQYKWKVEDPAFQARALVVAGNTMFTAGPPDIISEEDAFFALDDQAVRDKLAEQSALLKGKGGSIMWAVDTKTGKKLAEYKLESMPVWDGMIASRGSLYLTTMDGEVICYAGKGI